MRIFFGLLAMVVLSACQGPESTTKVAEKPAIEPCRIVGIDIALDCGVVEVFEDRDAQAGRRIPIHFAILRAKSDRRKPDAIFIFAGGPGQSAMRIAPLVLGALGKLNRERDIIFVDQRGTGKSNALTCDLGEESDSLAQGDAARVVPIIKDCLSGIKEHANPALYTTTMAVEDFDDVRTALGYVKINLWGGSYGTRAALEYLRRHPGNVRSAVLDGVAPSGMKLPLSFVSDGNAALDKLIGACDKTPECKTSFPNLAYDMQKLLTALSERPRTVEIEHPRTGQKTRITVTRPLVLAGMRAALYAPNFSGLIPSAVESALKGELAPIVALGYSIAGRMEDQIAIGMYLSVICAEDWPLVEAERTRFKAASREFYAAELVDDHERMCAVWPRGRVPKDYYDRIKSDVPVLLLSGGIDPATPPHHAEETALGLSRSKHLVAPNLGHGVSTQGCAPDLIKRFVEDGKADDVDGSCLARIPRPTFFQPLSERKAPK